jgi:hypothetical protein
MGKSYKLENFSFFISHNLRQSHLPGRRNLPGIFMPPVFFMEPLIMKEELECIDRGRKEEATHE